MGEPMSAENSSIEHTSSVRSREDRRIGLL
jgi:hypothetical protein